MPHEVPHDPTIESVIGRHSQQLPAALLVSLVIAGCGGEGGETTDPTSVVSAAEPPQKTQRPATRPLPAPDCPAGAANCARASGRIILVERVDPDGDGDAHFVLASEEGITAPGISVIDVRSDLRPRPLPGAGEMLAASGPVYEGSFGQRQIQADAIAVGPR